MKLLKIFFLVVTLSSLNTFAKNEVIKNINPTAHEEPNEVSIDSVRCEKVRGKDLGEFKEILVQNCNLNKPYSASLSQLLNEQTYFYCCQIK